MLLHHSLSLEMLQIILYLSNPNNLSIKFCKSLPERSLRINKLIDKSRHQDRIKDVYGIRMAAGDPSRTRTLYFTAADHLFQSHQSPLPCCLSFSPRALELLSGSQGAYDHFHVLIFVSSWIIRVFRFVNFCWSLFLFFCDYVQHKVMLGKYKRDAESLEREGENIQAVWSPDTKLIAILVSVF